MNDKDLVAKVKRALLKKDRSDYEKIRKALIGKHGYNKFRSLQLKAFKEL